MGGLEECSWSLVHCCGFEARANRVDCTNDRSQPAAAKKLDSDRPDPRLGYNRWFGLIFGGNGFAMGTSRYAADSFGGNLRSVFPATPKIDRSLSIRRLETNRRPFSLNAMSPASKRASRLAINGNPLDRGPAVHCRLNMRQGLM